MDAKDKFAFTSAIVLLITSIADAFLGTYLTIAAISTFLLLMIIDNVK